MPCKRFEVIAMVVILVLGLFTADSESASRRLRSFRSELLTHFQEISEIARTYPDATTKGLAELAPKAKKQVGELSAQDLSLLEETLSTIPNWRLIPDFLRSALEIKTRKSLKTPPGAEPPDCPAGLPNGIIDLYIAKDVAQAAVIQHVNRLS